MPPQEQNQDDAIGRRFKLLKERAGQESQKRAQQQKEGLKRQFSRFGGVGSGAFVKQSQLAEQERAEDLAGQQEALGVAEQGARQQQEEIQKQREFQTSERLGSQEFAEAQRVGSERFARRERLGAQEFQSVEAGKQRGFSRQLFDIEQKFKNKQLNASIDQFEKDLLLRKDIQKYEQVVGDFNMDMATKIWEKKDMAEAFANMHGYDPRTGEAGTEFSPVASSQGGGAFRGDTSASKTTINTGSGAFGGPGGAF